MDLSGKSPEIVRELLDAFEQECAALMDQLRRAAAGPDGDAMRRAAHTLYGAVGVLRDDAAEQAARRVEELARSGQVAEAVAAVPQLESEIERLQGELQAIREQ